MLNHTCSVTPNCGMELIIYEKHVQVVIITNYDISPGTELELKLNMFSFVFYLSCDVSYHSYILPEGQKRLITHQELAGWFKEKQNIFYLSITR